MVIISKRLAIIYSRATTIPPNRSQIKFPSVFIKY